MHSDSMIYGFKRLKSLPSAETGSTVVYYEHVGSGAQLIHLANEDQHMAFGIGFRTPPEDSTGVAHILEHSVLSGSRKFRTREPFMELLKGSMNTFLNAMTYPDMTIYPISSMNRKDLKNLVDVYMDSVLFPRIHEVREIFLQEGWHHHILEESEPITYNGVVYNEMRGAYSSAEANVAVQVGRALNEGTTYEHESGGYPYDIPGLSYEALKAFHQTHYHPSNSLLYLYGDVDLDEMLRMLDEEYLSHFQRRPQASALVLQDQAPGIRRLDFTYPAEEAQTPSEHSYLSWAVPMGRGDSVMDHFTATILNEVLINSESSPVKQALLAKNLGEDFMSLGSDTWYLDFGLAVKHTSDERLDEFVDIVEGTLRELTETGIDENLLLAAINHTEFKLREARGSLKGIIYFIKAMGTWRYGLDPIAHLNFDPVYAKLREGMTTGYFEKFIRERILENPVKILAVHRPKVGLFQELDQVVAGQLAEYKASLTPQELTALIEENQRLLAFQTTEDSKADKATIPHLELSDIDRHIPRIEEEVVDAPGGRILWHPWQSSDISYLTVSFSLADLDAADLFWVGLLSAVLGITDTADHTYADLNNRINIYTSGIHFNPAVYKQLSGIEDYAARFNIQTSAMGDYHPKMFEFIEEILYRTDYSSDKRLREILTMLRSNLEAGFDFQGHSIVMNRVASFFNQAARAQEELAGIAFYDQLSDLLRGFEERTAEIQSNLSRITEKIFTDRDTIISLTGEGDRQTELVADARAFLAGLPSAEPVEAAPARFELVPRREALTSASGVQYVAKGYNLKLLGYEYSGELTVLASILSMDYLHNAIRARGGAYGAGISIDPYGNAMTYSYRDPNLRSTVQTYDGMGDFLRELVLDDEDIKNYIIGSMTRFNPPLTASDINALVLARRFAGSSEIEIEKRMNQAIDTTRCAIMARAGMLDELMAQNYLSVLGNQDRIREQADLFSEIRPIKKTEEA